MGLTEQEVQAIAEARGEPQPTLRPTVPKLEERLFRADRVLDHGFVRVVDYMGDDAAVVQAARVSYGRGTRKVSDDAGLIRYLMRHHHSTPFEMAEIKFHVKLPIFVARQWIRHRTANVNEISGRYSVLDREFYLPREEDLAPQSATNRQGRSDAVLSPEHTRFVLDRLRRDAEQSFATYDELLNGGEAAATDEGAEPERPGLARELARIGLTLATYTQWYWKVDLHNLLGFLRLRADSHAQYEIRAYADLMLDIVRDWVPVTYQAFRDYRMDSVSFSAPAWSVVKRKLAGEDVRQETSGLPPREWRELQAVLDRLG